MSQEGISGNTNRSGKENRGFAAMDREQVRNIASEGGKAAHLKGTAHKFNSEEAAEAGRKGGQAPAKNSNFSRNHEGANGRSGGDQDNN